MEQASQRLAQTTPTKQTEVHLVPQVFQSKVSRYAILRRMSSRRSSGTTTKITITDLHKNAAASNPSSTYKIDLMGKEPEINDEHEREEEQMPDIRDYVSGEENTKRSDCSRLQSQSSRGAVINSIDLDVDSFGVHGLVVRDSRSPHRQGKSSLMQNVEPYSLDQSVLLRILPNVEVNTESFRKSFHGLTRIFQVIIEKLDDETHAGGGQRERRIAYGEVLVDKS